MILLRKLRAVAVVSALFGVSAAVISATINFGQWLMTPPLFPRSATFFYIFATVPFAFLVGCGIGVAFSIALSVRRATRGEQLRTRWLIGAGLLGGAAVGLVGAFVPHTPGDLPNAIARVLESVGLFSLIGAGTAGLAAWIIARASRSRPTQAPLDGLGEDPGSLPDATWSHARGTPDHESDPRYVRCNLGSARHISTSTPTRTGKWSP